MSVTFTISARLCSTATIAKVTNTPLDQVPALMERKLIKVRGHVDGQPVYYAQDVADLFCKPVTVLTADEIARTVPVEKPSHASNN